MKRKLIIVISLILLALLLIYFLFQDRIIQAITGEVPKEHILFTDAPGDVANKSYIDGETFIINP